LIWVCKYYALLSNKEEILSVTDYDSRLVGMGGEEWGVWGVWGRGLFLKII